MASAIPRARRNAEPLPWINSGPISAHRDLCTISLVNTTCSEFHEHYLQQYRDISRILFCAELLGALRTLHTVVASSDHTESPTRQGRWGLESHTCACSLCTQGDNVSESSKQDAIMTSHEIGLGDPDLLMQHESENPPL